MTNEQLAVLERNAQILEDASRAILAYSLGDRPFTYNPAAIEYVYRILDKGVSFERLAQVLNAHKAGQAAASNEILND